MGRSMFDTSASKPKPKLEPVIINSRTTLPPDTAHSTSIVKKRVHDPRKATIRSAIIPGWGQAYNREYWKIPIVYGALAIPVATFVFNNKYYHKTKVAYEKVYNYSLSGDKNDLAGIDAELLNSLTGEPFTLSTYSTYRNFYRQNRDYSVLWFLILWGVNVVDATVFGHLKNFDISDDLSMKVKPTFNMESSRTNIGLAFSLKKPEHRLKPLPEVR
ncbi:hypothetical protein FLA_4277 [Filimonas lacunae]|nr:hypothetical protein FLA_4277 [Filimonas lacunae]